jgi:hypothetical protein
MLWFCWYFCRKIWQKCWPLWLRIQQFICRCLKK